MRKKDLKIGDLVIVTANPSCGRTRQLAIIIGLEPKAKSVRYSKPFYTLLTFHLEDFPFYDDGTRARVIGSRSHSGKLCV